MVAFLLGYAAFLTFVIVCGIHHYEAKVKDYKGSISDYKRALDLSKNNSNATHYTWLQLENKKLNSENDALQVKTNGMQEELGWYRNNAKPEDIQYESSTYKSSVWDFSKYEISIEL